ncbi:peptide deformylase [Sinimarinibacterium sp. CAU 1509]|uniref:peptide deformylase n=1 Tax=Sinimarinibacterium sp. CAU 1509 TaxID=2562283 RepID=UPI0010AC3615|nr:peptide deformylase [Sinimarinibacterium sp. CAU 1509]TJY59907.1 peptide deformylase [Sinimarinibacterium sp. CAU 1509]
MALLTILHHPDPRLREKAQLVERFDAALQTLIDDMFETMYDAPGVGLAATQVGVALRLAVMDCSEDKASPQPMVIINPEIVETSDPELMEEGCLSVPGVADKIQRFTSLKMRALDRDGKPFELVAEDLLAQAIQHEIDHLDGTLYIDRLSTIKRDRLLKKLRKQQAA